MARPLSKGLQYTNLDVTFFQDRKVRRLQRRCGETSPMIYIALLCAIYAEGYYIRWDDDVILDIADATKMEEDEVKKVIDGCLEVGLLSKEMFDNYKVLTSHGIQIRYKKTCEQCKRKSSVNEFSLLVSSEETHPDNTVPDVSSEDMPQSKVKNSKEDYSFSSSSSPSSEVAPSEAEKQEEKFIAYMFFQNWASPGKEYRKFVAFNNTGGRCWAKMDETQRDAALVLWKQEPLQPKRFLNQHLAGWRRIYHLLVQLGAPYLLRIHALSDNIAIERENGNTTIRCPTDVMRFIEENRDAGFRAAIQEYFFSGKEITNLKFAECPP